MLLIDRRIGASVRFDTSFPALAERDFLFRSLQGGCVAVASVPLVRVTRGRADHTANAHRALRAYERYISKYAEYMATSESVRDWYHYMAMREAIRGGERPRSQVHYRQIQGRRRLLAAEYLMGRALGETGLRAASRLHLRPDWSGRCHAPLRSGSGLER